MDVKLHNCVGYTKIKILDKYLFAFLNMFVSFNMIWFLSLKLLQYIRNVFCLKHLIQVPMTNLG